MYNDLVIKKETRTMEKICDVNAFEHQKHQIFVKRWFENGNRKLLLFHGIGSGKTCTSILVLRALLDKNVKRIFVATPATLQSNYENEMKSKCGNFKTIPKKVEVMSHQKFISYINAKPKVLNDSMVIIDEIQNIVSSTGGSYRVLLNNLVCKHPKNNKVVLLSGSPIFDKPYEIAMTLNLLDLPEPIEGPLKKFNKEYIDGSTIKNAVKFSSLINGYVSAFKGIGPNAYAKKKNKVLKLTMDPIQDAAYSNSTIQGRNAPFYLDSRQSINCIYPGGKYGNKARKRISDKQLQAAFSKNLKKLSIKFWTCIQHLLSTTCVGPVFAYSNFVSSGGIQDFAVALKAHGFQPFQAKANVKGPTFAIFKTNAKAENDVLLKTFNSPGNKDGSIIKVIIGSPSMKEGVSLKNTREVHIFEPYWNMNRTNQIIGRAIRFCSHVDLVPKQRDVTVYNYIGLSTLVKRTSDEKIMDMAKRKQTIINKFEKLLYTSSIDCKLFHDVNGIPRTSCIDKVRDTKTELTPRCSFPCKTMRSSGGGCRASKENILMKVAQVHGIEFGKKKKHKPPVKVHIQVMNGNKPFYFKKFPELNNLVNIDYPATMGKMKKDKKDTKDKKRMGDVVIDIK